LLNKAVREDKETVIGRLLTLLKKLGGEATVTLITCVLHNACYNGHETIVELLLETGANVNASYGNSSPLCKASRAGQERIVQLLLNKGVNINAVHQYGSALPEAFGQGYERTVELLLNYGADVNAQGGPFGNALQAASVRGHKDIVELLLTNGANVNAQGGCWGNALQAASHFNHQNIVKLLPSKGAMREASSSYDRDTCSSPGRPSIHFLNPPRQKDKGILPFADGTPAQVQNGNAIESTHDLDSICDNLRAVRQSMGGYGDVQWQHWNSVFSGIEMVDNWVSDLWIPQ